MKTNIRYTRYLQWAEQVSQSQYRIGITNQAQKALGDIVYLELPTIGENVKKDEPCGFVESKKSVVDLLAPLSGTIVAINNQLFSRPQLINDSPYQDGWLFCVQADNLQEWDDLQENEPVIQGAIKE